MRPFPFFHNNSVETIEGAVAFYNEAASGRLLASFDPGSVGIRLDATQVVAVAAFLRVINALENIRVAEELLRQSLEARAFDRTGLERAIAETRDAIEVLACAGLHPRAVARLREAERRTKRAIHHAIRRRPLLRQAIAEHSGARIDLLTRAAGQEERHSRTR